MEPKSGSFSLQSKDQDEDWDLTRTLL